MGIINITTYDPDYDTLTSADLNTLQAELETESAIIDKFNISPNSLSYKNIKGATTNLSTGHSGIYGITTSTPTATQTYTNVNWETIQDAAGVPSDLEVIIGDVNGINLKLGDILRFEWKIQVIEIDKTEGVADPDLSYAWFKPQYEVDTGAGPTWTNFTNGAGGNCRQRLSGYATARIDSAVGVVLLHQEKYHIVSGSIIVQAGTTSGHPYTKCRMRIKQNQTNMETTLRDIQLNVIIERKARSV